MKKEDWNNGLSEIDPEIVEEFIEQKAKYAQKSRRRLYLRVVAFAACVCVLVVAVMAIPLLQIEEPDDVVSEQSTDTTYNAEEQSTETDRVVTLPGVNDPTYEQILLDATQSDENICGSSLEFIVGNSVSGGSGGSYDSPEFTFRVHGSFVVKARVVKNYSDVYYDLDVSSTSKPKAYRLVEMETIDVLYGNDIPKRFLYKMREDVFVDMSKYDFLFLSMEQFGTEKYVMRNSTKNKMESLSLPLFGRYYPELGDVIAFNDGVFDESLWQNENWIYGYQFAKYMLDESDKDENYLCVYRGCDESYTLNKIKESIMIDEERYNAPNVTSLTFESEVARRAIAYVTSFKHGIFAQNLKALYYIPPTVTFTRFINGCQTEETITINLRTEEVTYSDVRYTGEDMVRMENIAVHIQNKANEYAAILPTPPHTDLEGKKLIGLNVYGWYVKVDEKVYGVVKTSWRYRKDDDRYIQYYDDSYTLYDISTSTAKIIDRDALIKIVGERNVYQGEYGQEITMSHY